RGRRHGGVARRPGAAIADPDGHRDWVRRAGLFAGAVASGPGLGGFGRYRRDRTGSFRPHRRDGDVGFVMLLAFPILLPLLTAIVLQLLPHRPKLLRLVAFAGALG